MPVAVHPPARTLLLRVPHTKIIRFLFFTIAALLLFHIIGQYAHYQLGYRHTFSFVELFHLNRENNIPTFFSSLLLLSSALLLTGIYRFTKSRDRRYWLLLAVIFLGLSIDESVSLHELLIDPMREVAGVNPWFYYAWIIPAGIFLLVLGIYLLGFLRRLPAATRIRFLVAGFIFVGGAIGLEMVSGYYAFFIDEDTLTYNLIVAVEELMEMVGVVLFIRALFLYIHHHFSDEIVVHLREE